MDDSLGECESLIITLYLVKHSDGNLLFF